MEPVNCFLVFFDILGFKKLRETKGTNGLHELYTNGIKPFIEHSVARDSKREIINGISLLVPKKKDEIINYKIISDSILIYTKDDSLQSFVEIIDASYRILADLVDIKLRLEEQFLMEI